MIPLPVLIRSLTDWAAALRTAETHNDWTVVRHTAGTMEQCVVMLNYRCERQDAQVPTE